MSTDAADSTATFAAPPWTMTSLEPIRAALEYAGMRMMSRVHLPRGDGHAVVMFPGLASDKHALGPVLSLCNKLGYTALDWGRGFNRGPQGDTDVWLDGLAEHVQGLTATHREPISLLGWSLGGFYAREVAKRLGHRVRQVVTMGTPFAGSSEHTRARLVYRLLNGSHGAIDEAMSRKLRTPPPVPTTSIYSRSDGVVAWQACVQEGNHAAAENVEVTGSHCGLGWNAEVFGVLADRLSQPNGDWRPYARRACGLDWRTA